MYVYSGVVGWMRKVLFSLKWVNDGDRRLAWTQQTNNVLTTSLQRRCNVATVCICWETGLLSHIWGMVWSASFGFKPRLWGAGYRSKNRYCFKKFKLYSFILRFHRKLSAPIDAFLKARMLAFRGHVWWRKPEYLGKTTDDREATTTLLHASAVNRPIPYYSLLQSRQQKCGGCFVPQSHFAAKRCHEPATIQMRYVTVCMTF